MAQDATWRWMQHGNMALYNCIIVWNTSWYQVPRDNECNMILDTTWQYVTVYDMVLNTTWALDTMMITWHCIQYGIEYSITLDTTKQRAQQALYTTTQWIQNITGYKEALDKVAYITPLRNRILHGYDMALHGYSVALDLGTDDTTPWIQQGYNRDTTEL